MNFLNHFLTPFCLKWKKLPKNSTKMILIKFYTKFEQNTTFHVFEKKSKNVTFFRFSKLKIDVWLKMSVLSKIMEIFFLEFFKSLSDVILLKIKKTSKKNSTQMILINFYTKFEQNTTFHVFEKKSKKVTFFRFSNLKIDVWLKMSVLSKIMENFFLEFFKSLSNAILLKMKKTSKKLDKNDPNQVLHKIWAKHDFSCFRKKSRKKLLFFVFRNSKLRSD